MRSKEFEQCLNEDQKVAWHNTKAVIEGFLGKHRANDYVTLVENMLMAFKKIGVNMSLKIHFLHSHLDMLAVQLPSESDEHGERFHQQILDMEKRYKGKRVDRMLADFCWYISQDDYIETDEEE